MPEVSALSTRLRRAAESVGLRGGHLVPLRYGSAAGELAVCIRSVGLVDREDLRVLEIAANPHEVSRLAAALLDGGLDPGEAATVGNAHWGRLGPGRALAVLPADSAPLLCENLLRRSRDEEASVGESGLQAIGLIGPAIAGLLADLGGCVALTSGNGRGRIATAPEAAATWMLLDQTSALALVRPEEAVALWHAISVAGRRFGLGYVGAEAAERFETIRRQSGDRAGH